MPGRKTLTVLITGFGRFPGAALNPSGPLVAQLARARRPALADASLIFHVFPTSYAAVDRDLPALIARHRPDVLLMFGLAARTRHVRVETLARNAVSQLFPDALGEIAATTAIAAGAPARLRGRAPFPALLAAARASGIKAAPSRDAGRYVCNYLYWRALESAESPQGPRSVVFVHIPKTRLPARPRRSMRPRPPALADLVRAGTAILLALTAASRTIPLTAGSQFAAQGLGRLQRAHGNSVPVAQRRPDEAFEPTAVVRRHR